MRAAALLVGLAVVLAGCAAPVTPGDVDDGLDQGSPTPTVDPDNPWREVELSVAIRTGAGDDRDYAPLVREAMAYWEDNAAEYADYPVSFRLVAGDAEPDLVISFVDAVGDCGNVTDPAGCAPVPTSPASISRPENVSVLTGLSDASTVLVVKHELGHALGLRHEDDPQPLMAPTSDLTTLPQTDATDRAMPWADPELSVYVEYDNASDPDTARSQVGHALEYVAAGADGTVPDNVTFITTTNRSAADVVVQFRDTACDQDRGTCARRYGRDPDGDGALETYTRLEVTLADVDPAAVAWHVAYWLGYGFGFTEETDWPEPLRDASYEERTGDWWTDG